MITENDLLEAISECQNEEKPTSNTCMKLAAYYILKDRMYPEPEPEYSYAAEPEITYESDSEFYKATKDMDINELYPIMDELMNTLNVLNHKLYEGVMAKLLL